MWYIIHGRKTEHFMEYQIRLIEDSVRKKQIRKSKRLIQRFLRENVGEDKVIQACNWYRRLSLYRDGLNLIMRSDPFSKTTSGKIKIQTAEFLSIVGANTFALQLLQQIDLSESEEHEIVAGIYFSAGDFSTALMLFQKRLELLVDKNSYAARLTKLSCADCLANLNKLSEATDICASLKEESNEELLKAIIIQAEGEYLAKNGEYKKALQVLEHALKIFPGEKTTYDHALLFRWLGYALVKNQKRNLGEKYLRQSTRIIQHTGLREEVWLENIRLLAELRLLPKRDKQRLESIPGLRKNFFSQKADGALKLGKPTAPLKIHLSSNDYTFAKKNYLGLSLELQLLAYLRIAEDWGLGFDLIKTVLWPKEAHSYLQLEDRIIQLLKRCRKIYGVGFKTKKRRIYLLKSSYSRVYVDKISAEPALPPALLRQKLISTKEVMNIFSVRRTQAVEWLNKFVASGLLRKSGEGAAVHYTPLAVGAKTAQKTSFS